MRTLAELATDLFQTPFPAFILPGLVCGANVAQYFDADAIRLLFRKERESTHVTNVTRRVLRDMGMAPSARPPLRRHHRPAQIPTNILLS